jgi:hypothetical protein
MWGDSETPINNICIHIRICNAFAQLSHPSPRTVEPDRMHRTAGAVYQDESHFQFGNT